MQILENVNMAPYTTLGIGGPARFLLKASSVDQVVHGLEFARTRGCPVFVLGGGSNLLVSEKGFPGLVVKIELAGIRVESGVGGSRVKVSAGVEWDSVVRHCVDMELAGIECLSGIPGTTGGAPIQNINAYGQHISEALVSVTVLDRESQNITELANPSCRFGYRSSIFNSTHQNRYVLLDIELALRRDAQPCIHYADLQQKFAGRSRSPSLSEVREAVLQIRRAKAMVLDEKDPDSKSAGSFFKNPVLSSDLATELEAKARSSGLLAVSDRMPRFRADDGQEKIAAGWLIERAGFPKGYVHKSAGISGKHALALVNRGNASSRDIIELMQMIQARVEDIFGIALQPEPVFVGFGG
jgi:UDP-N-acetylmuramate dehydrogenase